MQHAHAAYTGLVQPEVEDKRFISAQWAKDEDTSRFLKSGPYWGAVEGGGEKTDMLVQNLSSSDIPIKYTPVKRQQLGLKNQLEPPKEDESEMEEDGAQVYQMSNG